LTAPLEEARRQFDVNVFGAMRLTQLVLPHMRAQRSGTVVNISSVGGKVHSPMGGWYHATKFALEALSDCLRLEVEPFGIDVVVIEPGGIQTEWGDIAAKGLLAASGEGAYAGPAAAMARSLGAEAGSSRNSPPALVADTIAEAVTAGRPKTRYAVGFGARPIIAARRMLPDRTFDKLIKRASGLPR
jgi:NAD(P)-dependent dehydrogenase (short-subunit alcohol dehydrogenase family)